MIIPPDHTVGLLLCYSVILFTVNPVTHPRFPFKKPFTIVRVSSNKSFLLFILFFFFLKENKEKENGKEKGNPFNYCKRFFKGGGPPDYRINTEQENRLTTKQQNKFTKLRINI
jgi:hypothetical protein